MNQTHRIAATLRGLAAGVFMLIATAVPAQTADKTDAVMLVATRQLSDPLYGATVLVVRPIGGGRHIGFIINKPTPVTVAQAFPRHVPSQKVKDKIFLGGPERSNSLFALVQTERSPDKDAMQLADDLFVVFNGAAVDQVIENDPEHARFVMGAVLWKRGELDSEIKRGAWFVEPPDTGVLMRKETGRLWEELVNRLEGYRGAV